MILGARRADLDQAKYCDRVYALVGAFLIKCQFGGNLSLNKAVIRWMFALFGRDLMQQ